MFWIIAQCRLSLKCRLFLNLYALRNSSHRLALQASAMVTSTTFTLTVKLSQTPLHYNRHHLQAQFTFNPSKILELKKNTKFLNIFFKEFNNLAIKQLNIVRTFCQQIWPQQQHANPCESKFMK